MFRNIEKKEACHGNAPQILFIARTTTSKSLKEAGFVFLLHKLVFHLQTDVPNATKFAHFHIRKGIFDWKQALERLRSHEHLVEHIDATITFSRRCS